MPTQAWVGVIFGVEATPWPFATFEEYQGAAKWLRKHYMVWASPLSDLDKVHGPVVLSKNFSDGSPATQMPMKYALNLEAQAAVPPNEPVLQMTSTHEIQPGA